jgi:hypothetical protein
MVHSQGLAFRGVLAVATSAVLVFTGLSPVLAGTAPDPDFTAVLPAVESTPAAPLVGSTPVGDFTGVSDSPVASDPVADGSRFQRGAPSADSDMSGYPVSARDQFSTTYDLPGGFSSAVIGTTPQNVMVDGSWRAVSDRISRSDSGWETRLHPLAPRFGLRASDEVSVTSGG